jgi:hypothetical protein
MRNAPDMSFIPPERREEVLRRITAIEHFLQAPGRKAAEAHAHELGIRTAQFYNLVRAWKAYGRPERVAGAQPHSRRNLVVTDEQASRMDEIIFADPRVAPGEMVRTIMRAGLDAGWTLPRQEIVARYVSRARPPLLPRGIENEFELLVDCTVLELPVRVGDLVIRPLATILIDVKQEAAVGLALSMKHPGADTMAKAILDGLRHGRRYSAATSTETTRIALPSNDVPGRLSEAMTQAGYAVRSEPVTPRGGGKVIEALLGRRSAGIKLRPWLVTAPLAKREAKTRIAIKPMSLDEAFDYARARLVGSRTTATFAHLNDLARVRLDAELDLLGQG